MPKCKNCNIEFNECKNKKFCSVKCRKLNKNKKRCIARKKRGLKKPQNTYTHETLTEAAQKSKSMSEMMKYFGITSGASRTHLKKRCEYFNVDISHFIPNKEIWLNSIKNNNKKKCEDIFLSSRASSYQLKRALIESGIEYKCCFCNQDDIWNGQILRLQVDHIDGNRQNNKKDNLRFLCPNCHTQTDNWGYKNKKNTGT